MFAMKKLYVLLAFFLNLCGVLTSKAQTVYPYFSADSTRQNLAPVAVSVASPATYVVNQSGNFTLEVQGTATVLIQIANGTTAYSYAPATTATVRFVKTANTVYVYENTVYKTALTQTTATSASGISGVSGTALHVTTSGLAPVISPNYAGGDYIEMTSVIANPSFESAFNGWTNDGLFTQTNDGIDPYKDGNTYVEKYVGTAPLPNASVAQLVQGLPNGTYTLKAGGHNILQNPAPATGQPGAFLFGNTTQRAVTNLNDYTFSFLVMEGKANIGFRLVNSLGNWAGIDNFRLQYKGFNTQSVKDSLQAMKDSANILLSKKMQNPARTDLTNAVDAAQQAIGNASITNAQLAAVYVQLQNAMTVAVVSINAYSGLQVAIDSATAVYGNGSGNRADSLMAAIQRGQTLAANLNGMLPALYQGRNDLYTAIYTYRLANATGPVPVVVTNPSFARGATAAFGRSTITGVAISSLQEHGFCYSTNPQPTVLDSKATGYFDNNGFLYRIQNLQPATVYYMRAYAITPGYAVGYGDVLKVITLPRGTVNFYLNGSVTSSPGNFERIKAAMESAVDYVNNLTSIQGQYLSVNYNAGTPTAEASYGGYMQFGSSTNYQRTGTALHEMAHTIGVGTHPIWYGPSSPLRQYGSSGLWLGERANSLVKLLNNDPNAVMQGDNTHMWPYGINGAFEDDGSEFLYTSNALIQQALGEDGLPPTGGFASPAYTFNQSDTAKYYIKTEDVTLGRNVAFLAENAAGQLYNKVITATAVLMNDSAAWRLSFNPATGYYQIKNVATGKYFTYQSFGQNGVGLTAATTPGAANNFQLMGARYNTQISRGGNTVAFKSYWMVWPEANLNPPALTANLNAFTSTTTFDFRNEATTQHWFILSKTDVDMFKSVEEISAPIVISFRAASGDTKATLTWNYQFGIQYTVLRSASQTGTFDTVATSINAARYVNGGLTNGNTYYYKVVAYNSAGNASSAALMATPTLGQHLYINFNDTATALAEDKWGGYHAQFVGAATRETNSAGNYLRLNGYDNTYTTLGEGTVSELNNFTIATWVKFNTLDNWARIFDFGNGTDVNMFLAPQNYTVNGKSNMIYAIKNSTADQNMNIEYAWPLNTWTYIALTQSNDSTKIFINGVQVASVAGITLRPADLGITSQNYLGKSQYNDPYLNGSLDEFRIYNYALNKNEIQTIYGIAPVAVPFAVAPRVASGDGRATLVWNYQNDASFTILRATTASGPYDTIATNLNAVRYVDASRTNNSSYYYKVLAYNSKGSSPAGAAMTAMPVQGRQAFISFDDTSATLAADGWNAYDATLSTAATRETGKVGTALKLNGSGESYANLYGAPVSELTNFTISAWVKMTSLADWMRIFDFGTGTDKYMFLTVQAGTSGSQSNVRYAIKNGGGEQIVNYPYAIPLNTWVNYAITQSGNTAKLFINGMLVGTNTNVTIKPADLGTTYQNYLGKAQYNDPLLNGSIDEFRMYNYGMTDSEVASLVAGTILPLKLISFEGKPTPAGNALNWKIVTDPETLQVKLEKSADGHSFTPIYSVAVPASSREQLFSYTDAAAKEPVAYYRLKMTDPGGKVTYSPIIALTTAIKGITIVGLNPSIVATNASLSIAAEKATTVTLVISDLQGHILQTVKKPVAPGSNLLPIDASRLAAGTYTLSIVDNNIPIRTPIRFVVSR